VPGLGYWIIGERGRAKALFGVSCVFLLLGFLQLQYGAVDGIRGGVYVPQFNPIQWMPTLGALATAGAGPVSYVMVTGILNWMACLDIFDRATGRWIWRLPRDEQEALAAKDGPESE